MTLQKLQNLFSRPPSGSLLLLAFLVSVALLTPMNTTTAQEPVPLPDDAPDAEAGLAIFGERCATCHGETGAGDGEMAENLPNPPRAFSDPAYRLTAVPAEMFDTITNGRIANGMPPFGPSVTNPIGEQSRWDLVAAIYSFSTPADAVAAGQEIYTATCADCHGEDGAAEQPDLTGMAYWADKSNEAVAAALPEVAEHEFALNEEETVAVVDYARAFSYAYVDALAPAEPIAAATITGEIQNATSDEVVTEGAVLLRAFNIDLEQMMEEETTVGEDGRYQFELTDVPADWVYLVSMRYNNLSFSSSPAQIDRSRPELELPITVYDQTTNPDVVSIERLHTILDFVEGQVQINELYVFSNLTDTVFMGEDGIPENGTVKIGLPAGAENVSFQRSFGSLESFAPADEVIQTETGYADTLPLRPGRGATTLLASYRLPYESGMTIAHPLNYPTTSASVSMADVGVTLEEDTWVAGEPRTTQAGTILTYNNPHPGVNGAVTFTLNGRPRRNTVQTQQGSSALPARNDQTELWLGAGVLLVVVAASAYFVRQWQTAPADGDDPQLLVKAIAELDDAYDAGEIGKEQYNRQRQQLKSQLIAIWNKGD